MEPVVCSICTPLYNGRLLWRPNKILHQDKEKTNIQTKVPPILLMARIIAKKNMRERDTHRERERGVCMFISIYEGRLVCLFCLSKTLKSLKPCRHLVELFDTLESL
jgi:hypothetical protein